MTIDVLKRFVPLAICANACIAIGAVTNNLGMWGLIGVGLGLAMTAAFWRKRGDS